MITGEQLATLTIRRVIFHDVPRIARGAETRPTLADDETEVDATRKGHLKVKLTRVIGSKSAYPICFNPESASPVPEHIRSFTVRPQNLKAFVAMSQQLAGYLFEQQNGAISAGLLCALEVTCDGHPGLVLMKLEREEGARLELSERNGKKTFAMSVLDNLVLTDGTRLFKTALFLRTGKRDEDFIATACDSQLSVASSNDMAKFWLRFLGCRFVIEPRVATQRFYESAIRFINESVVDPVQKNDLYEHLQSQLKMEKRNFSPRSFIEECVPENYHTPFREHLIGDHISLASFPKDISDIKSRLHRRAYHTPRGAVVSAPAEEVDLVEVKDDQIIVNDSLLRIDNK